MTIHIHGTVIHSVFASSSVGGVSVGSDSALTAEPRHWKPRAASVQLQYLCVGSLQEPAGASRPSLYPTPPHHFICQTLDTALIWRLQYA